MICPNDDSAACCGKCAFNVVAVIPCFGRFALLRQTVNRLVNKNRVKVLLVGHENEVMKIARDFDVHFLYHENKLLGEKWNAGFRHAKTLNPEAVLFVGSSDWVENTWVERCLTELKEFDMVGTLGCYLLDIKAPRGRRLVHWPGYGRGERKEETIGIGRMISARILDKFNWEPFDSKKDNSMDWQMWQNVLNHGGKVKVIEGRNMAISTNIWPNKHKFAEHWAGQLRSQRMEPDSFLREYFPEALNLFK